MAPVARTFAYVGSPWGTWSLAHHREGQLPRKRRRPPRPKPGGRNAGTEPTWRRCRLACRPAWFQTGASFPEWDFGLVPMGRKRRGVCRQWPA